MVEEVDLGLKVSHLNQISIVENLIQDYYDVLEMEEVDDLEFLVVLLLLPFENVLEFQAAM